MVCFLPLLFADGQPTCLEAMTQAQLTKFIPFMLQCCPGYTPGVMPPWWPANVNFEFPLSSPDSHSERWLICLRALVCRCYAFHQCQHVLRFCGRLAKLPPEVLSIQDSPGGLVNIYNRLNKKLIVTFKKRNQVYDLKPQTSPHKSLLPRKPQGSPSPYQQQHIEDIYLCNYCDEEFTSCKDAAAHESLCKGKPREEQNQDDRNLNQEQLMRYFGLCPVKNDPKELDPVVPKRGTSLRLSSRNYSSIPISSPLGSKMLNNVLPLLSQDKMSYIKQCEEFCSEAPVEQKPKRWPRRCASGGHWNTAMRRKKQMMWSHTYSFNKWQRAERLKTIATGLTRQSRQLLTKCKPCHVPLERVPTLKPGFQYLTDGVNMIVREKNCSHMNSSLRENDAQQDASLSSLFNAQKKADESTSSMSFTPLTESTHSTQSRVESVVIDLCSSDEEDVDQCAPSLRRNPVEERNLVKERNPVGIRHPSYGISAVSSLTPWQPSSLLTSDLVREHAELPVSDEESSEKDWPYSQSECSGNCDSECLCTQSSCSAAMPFVFQNQVLLRM